MGVGGETVIFRWKGTKRTRGGNPEGTEPEIQQSGRAEGDWPLRRWLKRKELVCVWELITPQAEGKGREGDSLLFFSRWNSFTVLSVMVHQADLFHTTAPWKFLEGPWWEACPHRHTSMSHTPSRPRSGWNPWQWRENMLFSNCHNTEKRSHPAILYGGLRSAWPSRGLNFDFQIWFRYKIKINSLRQTEAKLSEFYGSISLSMFLPFHLIFLFWIRKKNLDHLWLSFKDRFAPLREKRRLVFTV